MSITRQLFNEFRPLFRMLDEPFIRSPAAFVRSPIFDEAFPRLSRVAVDLREEGNNYVVEADLPGVQKENIDVRIGDSGRSLTIEGKVVAPTGKSSGVNSSSTTVVRTETNQVSERFVGNASFLRTVWLPHPVETTNVSAQLKDGVLTVSIPKAEDKASVTVPIQ